MQRRTSRATHATNHFLLVRVPPAQLPGQRGKILAVDPMDPSVQTEIRIKGVSWSGMEKIDMIPEGLWGTEPQLQGHPGHDHQHSAGVPRF